MGKKEKRSAEVESGQLRPPPFRYSYHFVPLVSTTSPEAPRPCRVAPAALLELTDLKHKSINKPDRDYRIKFSP